jgi:sulfite exporter TauE/SafE
MNWAMILGAGLLAGATTCAVTQGGLLVGLISRQKKAAGVAVGQRSLADDLAPVAGFLSGKLVSHTLLGFVLGGIGSLVGFDARVGVMAQWLAGILMVTLGLGSLGVPGFRDLQFTPPDSWLNVVRRSTRSQSAAAPFALGFAVLLVPCGVTISMEVLAASSGSPITGAAVMALFVLGTAPMFSLFGYLSQRFTTGRGLNLAMGATVVALGLFTLNAGMVAAGSPYSMQSLRALVTGESAVPVALPSAQASDTAGGTIPNDADPQVIRIDARSAGYEPNYVTARAGSDINLVFTTDNVWSCIRATTLPTLGKSAILPQTGTSTIELGTLEAGDYPISCSMGMYTATLHVV